jgi:hypothetical protein
MEIKNLMIPHIRFFVAGSLNIKIRKHSHLVFLLIYVIKTESFHIVADCRSQNILFIQPAI